MGLRIKSKVPELLNERGLTPMDLVRAGISYATAFRLAKGNIQITMDTLSQLVTVLNINKIEEIIEVVKDDEQSGAQ